jgi:hypothetical protein
MTDIMMLTVAADRRLLRRHLRPMEYTWGTTSHQPPEAHVRLHGILNFIFI